MRLAEPPLAPIKHPSAFHVAYYCNPWPTLKNCFRDALAADLCAVAGLFAVVAGPLFG